MNLNIDVTPRDFAGRTVNSLSQEWGTPKKYVDAVRAVFGGQIDLDPCSNKHSIVQAKVEYRLPKHDGLQESWEFPKIYVNPPYGSDRERGTTIKHWIQRCAEAYRNHHSEVLALVPVAPNTGHWKNYIFGRAKAVAFLYDTRLRFLVDGSDEGKGAPMACAMIYWGINYEHFFEVFSHHGAVIDLQPLWGVRLGKHHERDQPSLLEEEFCQ